MKEIKTLYPNEFPPLLQQITDPPKRLHVQGSITPLFDKTAKILCVVGSRKHSHYGKEVTEILIKSLRGYNVCIVSGLALGIDSVAHRAALDAGLHTIAFPGSGLDEKVLYPHAHKKLAYEIIEKGGALISEFDMTLPSLEWTFLARNRLMAGVSHAVLVIECKIKSGTRSTSKRAEEYNRTVAAVPGSIFSVLSEGPHDLIRQGATPISNTDDLLELLGFARKNGQSKLSLKENPQFRLLTEKQKLVAQYLERGERNKDILVYELALDLRELNTILTHLELEGFIKEEGGVVRLL